MHELVPSGLPLGQKKHTTGLCKVNQESCRSTQILHIVVPERRSTHFYRTSLEDYCLSLLQCSNLQPSWLTGNKSQHASAAPKAAKTRPGSSRIFFRKREMRWWRLNWRVFWRLRASRKKR